MHTSAPSSLDSAALARRLGELAGHEREVQVEFLLHLAETRWLDLASRGSWVTPLSGETHGAEPQREQVQPWKTYDS